VRACFQSNPKESHIVVVKRIFKYLNGTTKLCLWYPKSASFELIGYIGSDFPRSSISRKSTSGACKFLGQSLVSWSKKQQHSIALCAQVL
jgi:hypothetical protein